MFGEQASESLRRGPRRGRRDASTPARGADATRPDAGTGALIALPRAAARPIAGLPRDERGFVRSTRTGACPGSRASGRPATAPPSRSSRAASPPSRPTRPPRRSPPAPGAGHRRRSRSARSCAASCSPAAAGAGSAATSRRRATTARRSGARCGGRRRRSPARYLAPYLAMHAHGRLPDDERPVGRLVEFAVPVGGAP